MVRGRPAQPHIYPALFGVPGQELLAGPVQDPQPGAGLGGEGVNGQSRVKDRVHRLVQGQYRQGGDAMVFRDRNSAQ